MASYKHMTALERHEILKLLKDRLSFKAIAKQLGKDCTTIAKEVKNHRSVYDSYAYNASRNRCIHRFTCSLSNICKRTCKKSCNRCRTYNCNSSCSSYQEEICPKLDKPPYVCDGCPTRLKCALRKMVYNPVQANQDYLKTLSDSRSGISFSEEEIKRLDTLISPLIAQGQSIAVIIENHKDEIMVCDKTVYSLIDKGLLSTKNIDLPKKVRRRVRRKAIEHKVDTKCRIGRTMNDFQNHVKEYPENAIVEMDSVEGVKGGSCILSLFFKNSNFMLGFLREANDSKSVIDVFDNLENTLGLDLFQKMFAIIKTDNGSEFSNPLALEFNKDGVQRCHIFYCDPGHSEQKGGCEKNHEEFRKIVPKGTSMNAFAQEDINLCFDHVNSYIRKKLNFKSPFELFSFIYGDDVTKNLNIKFIKPDDVNLKPSLLQKGGDK